VGTEMEVTQMDQAEPGHGRTVGPSDRFGPGPPARRPAPYQTTLTL
jgi:hypothetical protein